MNLKIAQFLASYLPRSENFIYNLTHDLPGVLNVYFARVLENQDVYPAAQIVIKAQESLFDGDLKKNKPQLIHAHFGGMGPAALVYGLKYNLPVVTSFYGFDASRFIQHPPWEAYFPHLFKYGAVFIVLSNFMRQQLLDAGCPAEKIIVLRVGIDPERFRPGVKKVEHAGKRFLISSRLVEKKGIKYAVEAFYHLLRQHQDATLTILGDGPLKTELQELIRDLNLARSVTLIPKMGQEEVLVHLKTADIFLYPSVTGYDGDMEGTPTGIMEAAACGLPVLATRHAGIPEVVVEGETGILVPERNVTALVEGMEKLLANPAKTLEMGKRGRALIERHYNLEDKRRDLLGLYQELTATQKSFYSFPATGEQGKILYLRSVPVMDYLHKTFVAQEQFPDARLVALTSPSTQEVCQGHPLIKEVITYNAPRLSLFSLPSALKKRLRQSNFAAVIVPINNQDGKGFTHVIALAKLLGAKQVLVLNQNGQFLTLGWLKLLRLKIKDFKFGWLKNILAAAIASLAIVSLAVVYVIIKTINFFRKAKS